MYNMKKFKFVKDIDEEILKEIKKCKKTFEWSSSPNDECQKCKFNKYCKAEFFGISSSELFDYSPKMLKKMYIEQYLLADTEDIEDLRVKDEPYYI